MAVGREKVFRWDLCLSGLAFMMDQFCKRIIDNPIPALPSAEPDFHTAAAKHERFIKSTKFLKHGTPHHHTGTRDCQIIPVPACATVHSVAKRGKIGERMVGEAAESDDNSGMLYGTLGTQQLTTDNTYG